MMDGWKKDPTDVMVVGGLIIIALSSMFANVTDAKDIVMVISGGFIGYLTKQIKTS